MRALADSMYDSKENVDQALLDSWRQGTVVNNLFDTAFNFFLFTYSESFVLCISLQDSTKLFSKIISSCLQDQEVCRLSSIRLEDDNWVIYVLSLFKFC